MKTVIVIPARLGATRLPRKPLRLVGGIPLIVRVSERVREMALAEHVVVATDSEEIARVVRDRGGKVAMTRADHPSGTDRVAEVASSDEFVDCDVVVNVQGDEPFVPREAVAGALAMVRDGGFELGTIAARALPGILTNPDVVKVVRADDARALYFSRSPVPWLRDDHERALRDAVVLQHIGVYAYTPGALRRWVALPPHPLEQIERLEQLRPLAAGMAMGVALLDAPPPGGVDTEDDLARADARWTDLYAGRL